MLAHILSSISLLGNLIANGSSENSFIDLAIKAVRWTSSLYQSTLFGIRNTDSWSKYLIISLAFPLLTPADHVRWLILTGERDWQENAETWDQDVLHKCCYREHGHQINWTVSSLESLLSRDRDRRPIRVLAAVWSCVCNDVVVELYGDEESAEMKDSRSLPLDCN